jgi:predicted DNA-binding transcriptional regulator AlpA
MCVHEQRGRNMPTLIDVNGLRGKGFPFSNVHIKRLVAAGILPPPVKVGRGKNAKLAWVESEVDACIDAKIKERNDVLAAQTKKSKTVAKEAVTKPSNEVSMPASPKRVQPNVPTPACIRIERPQSVRSECPSGGEVNPSGYSKT